MTAARPAPRPETATDPEVPPGVRVVSAVTALAAAVGTVNGAATLATKGLPFTAATALLVGAATTTLFAAVALLPDESRRLLQDRTDADLADPLHALAASLTTVTLVVVFGLGSIVQTAYGLEKVLLHGQDLSALTQFTQAGVLRSVAINAVLFLVPAIVWTRWVDGDATEEAARRLGLRLGDPARGLAWGVGLVFASFLLLALVGGLLQLLGVQPPTNEQALALGRALTLPSALAVAAGAAVGEEVFFRGFLQTKIGIVPQGLLFSLAHFSYLNVLEALVTLALGLALGVARDRTDSLLGPILAHFGFNAVTFLVILYGTGAA